MKFHPLLIAFPLTFLLVGSLAALPEDTSEYEAWETRSLRKLSDLGDQSPEVSIPRLGDIVLQLSRRSNIEKEPRKVYMAARQQLLGIPGHAEFFGKEIKRTTDFEIDGIGSRSEKPRDFCFSTLAELPSPETVKVLGELLFDERNPFADVPSDSPWASNSSYAVVALHKLGLKNPPVGGKYPDHLNDLRAWQLWFEQVRAGTRTFSFKDDETIYSLAGAVAEAREPAGSPQRRDPREQNANAPGVDGDAKWPTITAAILVALALLLTLRKYRQGRSA